LDPLREQALAWIKIVLDRVKTLIAKAEAGAEAEKARETFGEKALVEAAEAFCKAYEDFEAQGLVVDHLTAYLEGQGYKDADFCFEDSAGRRHVHAAGIRALYLALGNSMGLLRPGPRQSYFLGFVRQLEQALLNARAFCSGGSPEPPLKLIPPNQVQWLDNPAIIVSPTQWKLLAYCREHLRADVSDVIDAVWGHDCRQTLDNLHSLKSKLTDKLSAAKPPVPVDLTISSGYLVTIIGPE